jgi:signal transduction histidine kinase
MPESECNKNDITEARLSFQRQSIRLGLYEVFHGNYADFHDMCSLYVRAIRNYIHADGVAIRVEHNGDYPYFVSDGFAEDFIARENSLTSSGKCDTRLSCMCGLVISGALDRTLTGVTEYGSFWTNHLSDWIGRGHNTNIFRNTCAVFGYESIALLPMVVGTERHGLLQVNASKANLFDDGEIAFLEEVAQIIGLLMSRFRMLEHMRLAKEAAEAAARTKSDFLAVMSHEIRTPMNAINGFSRLLARTGLDSKQREYIDIILESGRSLMTLIDEILNISRVESGKVVIQRELFDLETVIVNEVRMVSGSIENKNLTITLEYPTHLTREFLGDADLIGQIIRNLLGNAVKFTDDGFVIVSVNVSGMLPGRGNSGLYTVSICVKDTGIGIPEDKHDVIFDPFVQVDSSSTRRYGGAGLGLSIVKRYVALMDGLISVNSTPGRGTTFTVILPLADSSNGRPECGTF